MLRSSRWSLHFVVLCLLSQAGSLWAQEVTDSACGAKQSVYFANGVWATTNADARAELEEKLESLLRNRMIPEESEATKFDVVFNRSVTRHGDLIEAAGRDPRQ